MLNRVIHWFESGPVGTLLPYDIDAMEPFVVVGLLTEPRRTRSVECPTCKNKKLLQLSVWEERSVRCTRCAGAVQFGTEYLSVTVVHEWLARSLAKQIDDLESEPAALIEGRLWRLTAPNAPRPGVYLLRAALNSDLSPILDTVSDDSGGRRRVVITSSPLAAPPKCDPGIVFVSLGSMTDMDVEGLRLRREEFLPYLRDEQALWFDLPPPHDRLTLGGETLVLRGRHRGFMRLLREAHEAGHITANWRELLVRLGYGSEYSSLRQLFSTNASRFIGWSKGEVWIRKAPLPLASPNARAGPRKNQKESK